MHGHPANGAIEDVNRVCHMVCENHAKSGFPGLLAKDAKDSAKMCHQIQIWGRFTHIGAVYPAFFSRCAVSAIEGDSYIVIDA